MGNDPEDLWDRYCEGVDAHEAQVWRDWCGESYVEAVRGANAMRAHRYHVLGDVRDSERHRCQGWNWRVIFCGFACLHERLTGIPEGWMGRA